VRFHNANIILSGYHVKRNP